MIGGYSEQEIERLHGYLHQILGATLRCCERMGITPLIIGGSAIGAYYDGDILPWDDDIDIGMLRADYERFIREGQQFMEQGYFIQSPVTEHDMPYYFAKVRLDGSTFASDEDYQLRMHQGINIDIFPLDYVPENEYIERIHRRAVGVLENLYRISVRGHDGGFASWCYWVAGQPLPRRVIYNMLSLVQSLWRNGRRVNIVRMERDHIDIESITPPQMVRFGERMVATPHDLERYLNHHYPGLHRHDDESEQENHHPDILKFPQ